MPTNPKSLQQTVQDQLDANRIGRPVFIRWTETTRNRGTAPDEALTTITAWIGAEPSNTTTLGSTVFATWTTGESAIIATGPTSPDARPTIDLTVIGNSGAIYHTADPGLQS